MRVTSLPGSLLYVAETNLQGLGIVSLNLTLLSLTKSWLENYQNASKRGYLKRAKDGSCVSGMLVYLGDQLQMGRGIPMDAIERGDVERWICPFEPLSVPQVEVRLRHRVPHPAAAAAAVWRWCSLLQSCRG